MANIHDTYRLFRLINDILVKDICNVFGFNTEYNYLGDYSKYKYAKVDISDIDPSEILYFNHYIGIGCVPGYEDMIKQYLLDTYGIKFMYEAEHQNRKISVYECYPYYMLFDCNGIDLEGMVGLFGIKGYWDSKYNQYLLDIC